MSKLPGLTKSDSMSSLTSIASQAEQNLPEATAPELIEYGIKIMEDLSKRAEKKKYTALKDRFDLVLDVFGELSKRDTTRAQDLDTISTNVMELEAKAASQTQDEQDLRAHITTISEDIKECLDSLPTYRDLEHLIKKSQDNSP